MDRIKYVGKRIYFNQYGEIVFILGDSSGSVKEHHKNEIINYIDFPYGDKTIENAEQWHIDVENRKFVVDKIREKVESEEEKLKREKVELENQLLLQENNSIGGIM